MAVLGGTSPDCVVACLSETVLQTNLRMKQAVCTMHVMQHGLNYSTYKCAFMHNDAQHARRTQAWQAEVKLALATVTWLEVYELML